MNQSNSRLLDEMAKLMGDAAGVAQGLRKEAETVFKSQAERFLSEMDLVRREDFEILRELAIKANDENAELRKRVESLEEQLKAKAAPAKRTRKPAKKPTASSGE